jgi:hypothetical protein
MTEDILKELRIEGRDNNPANEEFFNSLISGLKEENSVLG